MAESVIIPFSFNFEDGSLQELLKVLDQIKAKSGDVGSGFANLMSDGIAKADKELEGLKKRINDLSDAKGLSDITDEVDRLTKEQAKNVKMSVDFVAAYKDQQEALGAVEGEIRSLRGEKKELQKQQDFLIAAGQKESQAYREVSIAIGKNEQTTKALTIQKGKVVQAMDREFKSATAIKGSYNELQATTNVLRQQLKNLPDAFGSNAKAAAKLAEQINKNNNKLKEFDKSIGDNFRNVGNYKDGLNSAIAGTSQFGGSVGRVGGALQNLKGGFEVAKTGFSSMKAGLASLGIGLLISALAILFDFLKQFDPLVDAIEQGLAGLKAVFNVIARTILDFGTAVVNAFKNPKKLLTDLLDFIKNNIINRFKAFGVILSAISKGDIKGFTNGILQLTTGVENATDKIAKAGAGLKDYAAKAAAAARAAANLKASQQDLADQMQIQEVRNAKALQQIAQLQVQAKNRTTSEGERIKLLQQADAIDEKNFKERDFLIKRELRNAQEAARIKGQLTKKELADLQARGTAAAIELQNAGKIGDKEVEAIKNAELEKVSILDETTRRAEKRQNLEDQLLEKAQADAEKRKEADKKRRDEIDEHFKNSLDKRIELLDLETIKERNALKKSFAESNIDQAQFDKAGSLITENELKKRNIILKNSLDETVASTSISAKAKEEIQADLTRKIAESETALLDFQIDTNHKRVQAFKDALDDEKKLQDERTSQQELQIAKRLELGTITENQADKELLELKLKNAKEANEKVLAEAEKTLNDPLLTGKARLEVQREIDAKRIESEANVFAAKKALDDKTKALNKQAVDDEIAALQQQEDLAFERARTEIEASGKSEQFRKKAIERLDQERLSAAIDLKQEEIEKLQAIGESSIRQEIELEKLKQQRLNDLQKSGLQARLKEAEKFADEALKNAFSLAQKESEAATDKLDKEAETQQKNIDVQRQFAEEGKKNTLGFELEKANEIQQLKLQEQKKQERLQKLTAFYELFKTFTSKGDNAPVAAAKAAAGLAIAGVIAAKLSEGTYGTLDDTLARRGRGGRVDSLGRTHGRKHSQGGILVEMEGGEGMFSGREMDNLPPGGFNWLKRRLRRGRITQDLIRQSDTVRIMQPNREGSNDNMRAIQDLGEKIASQPKIYYGFDTVGNLVEKKVKDGMTTILTITGKKERRRIGDR